MRRYLIHEDRVEYENGSSRRSILSGADPGTFTPLVDPVQPGFLGQHFAAKDRTSVWFTTMRVDGADPESFTYFHGGQCKWGTDRNHIYCFYMGGKPSMKRIKGDPRSFRFLVGEEPGPYMRQYALDDRHVYYYGRRVLGADPKTLRNLPKDTLARYFPPLEQEERTDSDFYRDAHHVFFQGRKLQEIDPDSFILFQYPGLGNRVCAIDKEHTYCVYLRKIPGASVSGTSLLRLTREEVASEAVYGQIRDYLSRWTGLVDYWFNRDPSWKVHNPEGA
jgi:hypothetical protein